MKEPQRKDSDREREREREAQVTLGKEFVFDHPSVHFTIYIPPRTISSSFQQSYILLLVASLKASNNSIKEFL